MTAGGQLEARERVDRYRVRLVNASPELRELVAFMGLENVLTE